MNLIINQALPLWNIPAMEELLVEDCFEDIFLEPIPLEPELDSESWPNEESHVVNEGPSRSEQSGKIVQNKSQSSSNSRSKKSHTHFK